MLRSMPCGRGGAGGTAPALMRSVQSANIVKRAIAAEAGDRAAHARAVLADLDAAIPRGEARIERAERGRHLARRLVAHLMADVAVGLDAADKLRLVEHLGRDAVARVASAGELIRRRHVDHRVPVVGGIVLRGGARVRRLHGGQRQVLTNRALHRRRVDEAVAANPHLVVRLRQIGHDEAALIVGDDDLVELRRRVGGLGDHPDAGFRSIRAVHDAADVIGVQGHGIGRGLRGRRSSPAGARRRRQSSRPVQSRS